MEVSASIGLFPTTLAISSEPYIVLEPAEIDCFPPYPFPLLNTVVDENWEYVASHHVLLNDAKWKAEEEPTILTVPQFAVYLNDLLTSGRTYGFFTVREFDSYDVSPAVVIATFRRIGNMPSKRTRKRGGKKAAKKKARAKKIEGQRECLRCRKPFTPTSWKGNWICANCSKLNERIRDVSCRRAILPAPDEDSYD